MKKLNLDLVARYAKALGAALTAGAGALATALADGQVSQGEKLGIALAIVSALSVVAKVANRPAPEVK